MNTKIIGLLLLVMLFATPALAAITVTWVTPSSGARYNNLQANAGNVDLNFTIADDNALNIDHNVTVIVYNSIFETSQTLVEDMNVRYVTDNTVVGQSCDATVTKGFTGYSCSIIWDMPLNEAMADGVYYIDANVTATNDPAITLVDTNALRTITISTSLANAATIRSLLLVISIIAAAGIIIIGIFSITMLNADPAKTAIAIIGSTIAIAIIAMVLGAIVVMI